MRKKYTEKQLITAANAVRYSFDNDVGLFDAVQKYKADPELAINFWTDAVGNMIVNEAKTGHFKKSRHPKIKRKAKHVDDGRRWHIGHVKPLSSFDLTDREQFQLACHYTNMVPVWIDEEDNSVN